MHADRDYRPLLALRPGPDREQTMARLVDALWDAFHPQGVSWVGFYLLDPENPTQLLLHARRDKPACSPIGLHGVCGRGHVSRRAVVVSDVAVLGPDYIACDPRDRSEVVVPLINPDGSSAGVLDVDSHEAGAFSVHDALSLARLMRHLGLSFHRIEEPSWVDVL